MATTVKCHQVAITPEAYAAMEESGQDWEFFFEMHLTGNWSNDDYEHNKEAIERDEPLVTFYQTLKGRELAVITDAERTNTRILIAREQQNLPAFP